MEALGAAYEVRPCAPRCSVRGWSRTASAVVTSISPTQRYRAVRDHFEGKPATQLASGKWLAESGAKAHGEAREQRAGWETPFLPATHLEGLEAPYTATPVCAATPHSWANTLARSLKLRNVMVRLVAVWRPIRPG